MTPDLARLLVTERREEAEQRRARRTPPPVPGAATPVRVPRQRRGSGLLSRIVPRGGVRIHTR